MRLSLEAALLRLQAPLFVILAALELKRLRQVTDLAFRLMVELVVMSDWTTGKGSTSYAVLAALCTPHRAPQAHRIPGPTPKRLRTAIQELIDVGLLKVDRRRNEAEGGLFFKVQSRTRITPSDGMKGRGKGRGAEPAKQATARPSGPSVDKSGQDEGQGYQQRRNNKPPTPTQGKLSTSQAVQVRALAERLRHDIAAGARGKTRAP